MLCTRCRRVMFAKLSATRLTTAASKSSHSLIRTIATVPSTPDSAPSSPPHSTSRDSKTPAPAIFKSGTSQPFSTPFFPSTSADAPHSTKDSNEEASIELSQLSKKPSVGSPRKLSSSVSGGSELKGLGYLKNKPNIYAKEDDEYPPWLWNILDQTKSTADPSNPLASADVSSMTKKQRAKYERKQAKMLAGMEKPIPVHEQSRDLTGSEDNAFISLQRRQELTRSSRAARRKSIREDNFLRAM